MVKEFEGYHTTVAQIPDMLWEKLCAEAAADGDYGASITQILIRILAEHYQVSLSDLPKRKRAGRKPKSDAPAAPPAKKGRQLPGKAKRPKGE